jgi:hypothetical protein
MNIDQAFPSKYLKAEDLQGRPHIVKMNFIRIEEVGQGGRTEKKPVLYFVGKEKGLVLNITNANAIKIMHGRESDDWTGKEIEIYPTETDFQGDRVPCIRVREPRRQTAQQQPDHIAPNARNRAAEAPEMRPFAPLEAKPAADFDDEIPW